MKRRKTFLNGVVRQLFRFKFMLLTVLTITQAKAQTTVNSLTALIPYLDDNNVNVKLASGTYTVTENDMTSGVYDLPVFYISGNNSTYDFSDATIQFETSAFLAMGGEDFVEFSIVGSNTVVKNVIIEDLGVERPWRTALGFNLAGSDNRLENVHITVRGSKPYGYGDIFGKGSGYVIKHHKHSAIRVTGYRNHVLNCTVIHRAYGHGIFVQGGIDTVIEGCYLEGEMNTTDAVLSEDGSGSDADLVDFMSIWGYTVPTGWTFSCQEDAIRAYYDGTHEDGTSHDTENMTVRNCTVKNFRNAYTLGSADGVKYVENSTAIGCEEGFWLGAGGQIVNCSADAQYGPAYNDQYQWGNNVSGDITILQSGSSYGNHNLMAYFAGSNHDITFHNAVTSPDSDLKIMIGGQKDGLRLYNQQGENNLSMSDFDLINETAYPVIIASNSSDVSIESCGTVTDNGSNNTISTPSNCSSGSTNNIALGKTASQSSGYSTSSGLAHEAVDGNTNGVWSGGSVTHTQANTSNPWWEVDLDGTYDIDEIIVFNRTDNCCKSRLSNFTVSVMDGNTTTFSQTFSSYPDPSLAVNTGNVSGDVIRVQINGTGTLSLAEVEAYGELSSAVGGDFQLVKRNSTGFAIDGGGNNGAEGRSVELYTYVQHNNLTWTEISRGGGYYSYQKRNSNVCFDGGDGGGNGQDVTLEVCDANDQNQHWLKIDAGNGHYRLEKRGTNFSLDGGGGGAIDQNVYLWTSNSNNQNQQWRFDNASSLRTISDEVKDELTQQNELKMYPNPIVDQLTIEIGNKAYNQFSIYNVNGSIIKQGEVTNNENQFSIDFSEFNKGIYVLMLNGRAAYKSYKVIKK